MSGYHKSKEVYRHHRTIENDVVIIPVRNLYISGQYLAPVYEDHNVTITSMQSSNSLIIKDYTTKSENTYDPSGVEFIDCNWTKSFNITDYTSKSMTQEDSTVRFIDCNWVKSFTITSYTQESDSQNDSAVRFIDCNWVKSFTISEPTPPTPPDEVDVPTDHYVTIISMESNNGTIIT